MASRASNARAKPSPTGPKTQYLVLYNVLSLVLWIGVLYRLSTTALDARATTSHKRRPFLDTIYPATSTQIKWTQTLALVEIAHAAAGLVRTSIVTTGMQVASRLLLVWGVVHLFGQGLLVNGSSDLIRTSLDWGLGAIPGVGHAAGVLAKAGNVLADLGLGPAFTEVERNQIAYAGMLLAWSVTECIRYAYFVFSLGSKSGQVPAFLTWLRYNTFFLLYPIGISCECWLVYHAIPFAAVMDERYAMFLRATLAIYVPGSYILYTHMMSQRRKVMKGKAKAKKV